MSTHTEMMDLLPLYALDALEGPGREALEGHLDTCDPCQRELARTHSIAAMWVKDSDPPHPVWARIVAELETSCRW